MPTKIDLKEMSSKRERLAPGHRACAGCPETIIVRQVLQAIQDPVVVASPTGCLEIITSPFPFTSWRVPWIHSAFENVASTIAGVESMYRSLVKQGKMEDRGIKFIAFAGDGATYDIGLQFLSGALERGHRFLYVCLNNEAYMNTGIQRSSSTPFGASTTTSPAGKTKMGQITWKKNMAAIAAAHNIPYVATACPSYPIDLIQKVKKAADIKGAAYIHILSVCPTGWRSAPDLSIKLGRLAVETGTFPLYEVEHGRYHLNIDFPKLKPIKEYMKLQGRFRHLTEEMIEEIQTRINHDYEQLRERDKRGF